MPTRLTLAHLRHLRLSAQRLTPDTRLPTVAALLRATGGLQAQELPAATLSVRPRTTDLTAENVRHARETERSIVMTWAMRGTLHFIPAAQLPAWLGLLGPIFIRQSAHRYQQLGLTTTIRQQALAAMQDILGTRGPLTRPALAEELAARDIPTEGQAIAHLVRYAALERLICLGPAQDGDWTYVLLSDWLGEPPAPVSDDEALASLAGIYWQAYGPATPDDFASWAGLSKAQARQGFAAHEAHLVEVETPLGSAWLPESALARLDAPIKRPLVTLLPRYDTLLLGYRSRDGLVDTDYAKEVHPGGGIIRPVLLVDGQAAGIWKLARQRTGVRVVVSPFGGLDAGVMGAVEAEAMDVGRFLGEEAVLVVE